ncbi:MAG: hypothetical protein DRH15_08120 [Deltaproteobacteria bacterium]|nr:MAG: hypothetical protein DRH15_08120 [Deltaproteobacteria bacterium]
MANSSRNKPKKIISCAWLFVNGWRHWRNITPRGLDKALVGFNFSFKTESYLKRRWIRWLV